VLARLRYNDPGLLSIFGGSQAMIESPLIQELMSEVVAKERHKYIVGVLEERFGSVPQDILTALGAIQDAERLDQLNRWAVRCPDLEAFRQRLTP
jgi:hypothetical protein